MKNVWLNYLISIQIIGMLFLTVSLPEKREALEKWQAFLQPTFRPLF
jgi:hypothetical protein